MLILTLRTDKPEAELGLYDDEQQLAYHQWLAHRELAETLHQVTISFLQAQGNDWQDIKGLVAYRGPGSFTGLRIGLSVINALSAGLSVPVVASNGENWQQAGVARLLAGEDNHVALPEYGAPVHITTPKK